MIQLMKFHECPACGKTHHFALREGERANGRECTFFCPESGRMCSLRIDRATEPANYQPQGAVQLTPV